MSSVLESDEYNNAIYVLLDEFSNVNQRLAALRYLYQIIQDGIVIDPYNRKKINQLVLDNVLKIMLEDAASSNSFKQQLIRVELFTLLSHILRAENLFGNEVTEALRRHAEHISQRPESPPKVLTSGSGSRVHKSPTKQWIPSSSGAASIASSQDSVKSPLFGKARLNKKKSTKMMSTSASVGSLSSTGTIDPSQILVKEMLAQLPKSKNVELSSKLKPRAAVLFSDSVSKESFVPGVDPTNFIEQDRKLGYQKPRMWFPTAMMTPSKNGLDSSTAKSSGVSQVVEEYLRMRALATYLGDAVVPLSGNLSKYLPSTSILAPTTLANGKIAPIDPNRYQNAVKEVMDMWTPILAAHRPPKGKKQQFSYLRSNQEPEQYPIKERKVHEEYVNFKEFEDENDKHVFPTKRSKQLSREEIMKDLEIRKEKLKSSISSITNRINSFMDQAYNRFNTKYLLVMEGGQSDARKKLISMTRIFLRHKRRNLLMLAFGMLKVPMVEAALKSRTPQYMKVAACNLLLGWLKRARRKNFQRWMARWVYITSCIIFAERMKAAAIIQTMVRRNRDRKRFYNMHKSKPYLGPLSDIRLGVFRSNIRYKIPRNIRTERRMYWLAATLIQTCFRCWFESKDYFLKKRRIVLLQSICRMWPKYRHYQRLKKATVKSQARARRTLWRNHYLRLKAAAIVTQKYVRRFLAVLVKLDLLNSIWVEIEEEKLAVIKIQRRVRIHRSKRKLKGKRMYKKMLQWGALVIQRNWYRKKRAFHTFFLMCALREREAQDIALEKLATKMGRYQCARRIQRLYRQRYWARVVANVIRVQCWYRGRLGFRNAEKLRKQRWASRKLYYWAKGLLKRRHMMARRIQKWWWHQKKRRLLKHLWALQKMRDKQARYAWAERRHHAALRIQAIVKGVWDRRWVKRTRAAMKIQKNWRFLHGLKKWKRMKKDHIMRGVQRAVNNFIDKAIKLRVAALMKYHIVLVTKVQALMRGFVVRCVLHRTRQYAKKLAPAVITVQRFWRKAGMLLQAVEEVLARRRIEANPFKFCQCLHEVMVTLRRELKSLYSLRDPRIGMRVSDFLYRLGYFEYLDLFPKRDFKYVTELQTLTMEKLTELYTMAQNRKRATTKENANNPRAKANAEDENKKRKLPLQDLQTILNAIVIPLYPKKKKDIAALQTLQSFPEYATPQEAIESIRSYFLKQFGRHLQARATNIATEIVENAFYNYNTYRSFAQPVTKAQVMRALTEAPESAAVLSTLDQIRQVGSIGNGQVDEWIKTDTERMKQTFGMLQMAYDRAFDLLPHGSILTRFERTVSKGAAFKRKADYLKKKAAQLLRMQHIKAAKQQARGIRAPAVEETTVENGNKIDEFNDKGSGNDKSKRLAEDSLNRRLTPSDCVESPFYGNDKYLDLEYFASSARLYLDLVDKFFIFSMGVQSLKNAWHNKAMRRAIQAEKRKIFLEEVTTSYLTEQHTNKVLEVWEKLRNKEIAEKKYRNIIMAARARKYQIEALLGYIPRYHIHTYYDDPSGYEYYVDEHGVATYELPIYSFAQYLAAEKIQHVARKYIELSLLRRLQREEEERERIRAMEEAMLQEQRDALKACVIELRSIFDEREMNSTSSNSSVSQLLSFIRPVAPQEDIKTKKKDRKASTVTASLVSKSLEEELEDLLPWKYRFAAVPHMIPGMWALYFPVLSGQSVKTSSLNESNYLWKKQLQSQQASSDVLPCEIVVVFRIRVKESLCDIRSFKGVITKDVPLKRLRHLPYHVGFPVECRFRYRKLFYRAKVHRINEMKFLEPVYDVTYEDGEQEFGLGRDAMRPSAAYLLEWFAERDRLLKEIFLVRRRQLHFAALRKERMLAYHEKMQLYMERKRNGQVGPSNVLRLENAKVEDDDDNEEEDDDNDHEDGDGYDENGADEAKNLDKEDSMTVNSQEEDAISVLSMDHEDDAVAAAALTTTDDASTVAPTYQSPSSPEKRKAAKKTEKRKRKNTTVADRASSQDETPDNNETLGLSKKHEHALLSFFAEHKAGESTHNTNHTKQDHVAPQRRLSKLSLLDPNGPAMIKVKLRVTRRALHTGWQIISPPNSSEPVYYNPQTQEERSHTEAPFFTATEIHMVHRVQAKWFRHKAMLYIRRYLAQFQVPQYIESIIQKGSKVAFVGFKQEGLTCLQMLTRAGYWEAADMIRDYYRDIRRSIWQLSIEDIATKRPEEFERIGILQPSHIRDLKEFQSWWKKTLPYERENKLSLINYYSSPDDPRSIEQCIQDSAPLLLKKFTKAIKSSQAKTKRSVDGLVAETKFPLTHAQIDVFLKKYADHPDQARDAMLELVDRHTCNTQVEERKVYELYRHCATRVAAVMGFYKLKRFRHFIRQKLKFAEDIVHLRNVVPAAVEGATPTDTSLEATASSEAKSSILDKGKGKELQEKQTTTSATVSTVGKEKAKGGLSHQHSGPEAKAAWLLRRDVLQYFLDFYAAVFKIQRHVKRYLRAKKFKTLLLRRHHAVDQIQRVARRYFAYKKARFLRLQQASPWEQLWQNDYNALYYYNYLTGQSTYVEPPPEVSFRPLVRHPVSAALMQAWPALDEMRKHFYPEGRLDGTLLLTNNTSTMVAATAGNNNSRTVIVPPNALCNICDTRLGVKLCLDCLRQSPVASSSSTAEHPDATIVTKPTNYCLPCYAKAHPADHEEVHGQHRYVVITPQVPRHGHDPTEAAAEAAAATDGTTKTMTTTPDQEGSLYLHCCVCDAPATRKCQGLYSDAYIDFLCERLKKATLADWRQVVLETKFSVSQTSVTSMTTNNTSTGSPLRDTNRSSHRDHTLDSSYASPSKRLSEMKQLTSALATNNNINNNLSSTASNGPAADDDEFLRDDRGSGGDDKTRLIALIEEVLTQTTDLPDPLHDTASAATTTPLPSIASLFTTASTGGTALIASAHANQQPTDAAKYSALSPLQLQSIRSLFNKLRAECDECYCQPCYLRVHSKGKRQWHIWKGFQAKVHVCSVCQSSPVENDCIDCSTEYCEPCFKVFHAKGQKRKHKHQPCREQLRHKKQDAYCALCAYRVGRDCPRGPPCTMCLCEECAEFHHIRTLNCAVTKQEYYARRQEKYDRQQQRLAELLQQEERAKEAAEIAAGVRDPRSRQRVSPAAGMAVSSTAAAAVSRSQSPSTAAAAAAASAAAIINSQRASSPGSPPRSAPLPPLPPACTICGEDADKICVECGDYYCSRTWLGNPGCFVQVHSRGNRASHSTEPLNKAKLVLFQRQQKRMYEQKPMSATAKNNSNTVGTNTSTATTLLSRTAPSLKK